MKKPIIDAWVTKTEYKKFTGLSDTAVNNRIKIGMIKTKYISHVTRMKNGRDYKGGKMYLNCKLTTI